MRPFELLIVLLEAECLLFVRFIRLELKDGAIIGHFMRLLMLLPPSLQLGTLILVIRSRGEVGRRFEATQVRIYLIKVH
jgi:hypothetical protein